jgi:hypothetical protein
MEIEEASEEQVGEEVERLLTATMSDEEDDDELDFSDLPPPPADYDYTDEDGEDDYYDVNEAEGDDDNEDNDGLEEGSNDKTKEGNKTAESIPFDEEKYGTANDDEETPAEAPDDEVDSPNPPHEEGVEISEESKTFSSTRAVPLQKEEEEEAEIVVEQRVSSSSSHLQEAEEEELKEEEGVEIFKAPMISSSSNPPQEAEEGGVHEEEDVELVEEPKKPASSSFLSMFTVGRSKITVNTEDGTKEEFPDSESKEADKPLLQPQTGDENEKTASNQQSTITCVAERLDKAVRDASDSSKGKNRSPELVPLMQDYQLMRKKLRSLIAATKNYQKYTVKQEEARGKVSPLILNSCFACVI